MNIGQVIVSEGYRFEVSSVNGRNFTAVEEGTGRTRQGVDLGSHGGGTEVEWLDGDPNWHENAPRPAAAAPYTPPPAPDPTEGARPSRFDRDPFDD